MADLQAKSKRGGYFGFWFSAPGESIRPVSELFRAHGLGDAAKIDARAVSFDFRRVGVSG